MKQTINKTIKNKTFHIGDMAAWKQWPERHGVVCSVNGHFISIHFPLDGSYGTYLSKEILPIPESKYKPLKSGDPSLYPNLKLKRGRKSTLIKNKKTTKRGKA